MRLQTKQLLPLGIITTVFLVSSGFQLWDNQRLIKSYTQSITSTSKSIESVYLDTVDAYLQVLEALALDPLQNDEPNVLNNMLYHLRNFKAVNSAYFVDMDEAILADGIDEEDIENLGEPLPAEHVFLTQDERSIRTLLIRGNQLVYSNPFISQGQHIGRLQVRFSLEKLRNSSDQLLLSASRYAEQSQNHMLTRSFVIGICIIIGLTLAAILIRTVVRRMWSTVDAMADIAEGSGNLSQHLNEDGNDEFSQLAAAFNKFVDKIKAVVDLVIQSSNSLAVEAENMSSISGDTRNGVMKQQTELSDITLAVGNLSQTIDVILGGCPRIENLLRKSPFGQISRSFSLNSHHYSPQMIKKSDSKGLFLATASILGQPPRQRGSRFKSSIGCARRSRRRKRHRDRNRHINNRSSQRD